eukprot:3726531-Rhodomonas_salina.2
MRHGVADQGRVPAALPRVGRQDPHGAASSDPVDDHGRLLRARHSQDLQAREEDRGAWLARACCCL